MFMLAQFVVPVSGAVLADGIVGWPLPVRVVAWFVLAALLGTLLGLLRECAASRPVRGTPRKVRQLHRLKPVRRAV